MKQAKTFELKNDTFRKARGSYSRFLNIYCYTCKNYLLLYQKDGPGPLKRLYFDRIIAPDTLTDLQKKYSVKKTPKLMCFHCKTIIGTAQIYDLESRECFHLRPGYFYKKLSKGVYPPPLDT